MKILFIVVRSILATILVVGLSLLLASLLASVWPQAGFRPYGVNWWLGITVLAMLHLLAGIAGGLAIRLLGGEPRELVWAMALVLVYGLSQVAGDWGHPDVFWGHIAVLLCAVAGIALGARGKSRRQE